MSVRLVLIITCCSILQSGLTMQAKSSEQGVRRDLAGYDQAGPYELNNDLHPDDADKILGEIRGFLWEHWKGRHLGLVTATFFTIEGDPTKSRFFVEPDAKGCWLIRIDSESIISAHLPKGRKPRREITHDPYDEIERVEIASGSSLPSINVPAEAVRQPQTYRLRLRNSRTNSLRIF
jgi:hypothetical protein